MSLERVNPKGTLKINGMVFTSVILAAVAKAKGKVLLASEKGKILGGFDKRVSHGELIGHIKAEERENEYFLEFFVITEFGSSIKELAAIVMDSIEADLLPMLSDKALLIDMKIVGVKSKKIALRDLLIERRYEVN